MNSSLKFLIVDDMPQMCKIIYSILTDLGWKNITIATSGEKALKLLQEKEFDVMLLDNNMPGMEGLEVLEQLQKLNITTKPKVMMLTADRKMTTVQAAIKLGVSDFLVKPFKPQTLLEKIEKLGL
ncbi:response regulator [Thiosulfativibrio zosterae]|uniref:Response regulator n=1 Tax=Thiosulfativibrio zosterae TaxID=2675053 RepID=A0A6F8PQQ9_9GAMM|nr:response regulator [Thiosulfativibrio zosterae]BBP44449.1 response regulator [Thiosulfativibrio zosterae]